MTKGSRPGSERPEKETDLQSTGELDHLFGLNVLQSVDTGDTIPDGQDSSRLFQIRRRSLSQDPFFQNGGHFSRPTTGQSEGRGGDASHSIRPDGRVCFRHLIHESGRGNWTHNGLTCFNSCELILEEAFFASPTDRQASVLSDMTSE